MEHLGIRLRSNCFFLMHKASCVLAPSSRFDRCQSVGVGRYPFVCSSNHVAEYSAVQAWRCGAARPESIPVHANPFSERADVPSVLQMAREGTWCIWSAGDVSVSGAEPCGSYPLDLFEEGSVTNKAAILG